MICPHSQSENPATSKFCRECGLWGTVTELLFEKKGLIPAVQQLLVSYQKGERRNFTIPHHSP